MELNMDGAAQVQTNHAEESHDELHFEYQALGDYDIRLLRVLPGMPGQELKCECLIVRGCKGPRLPAYTAISYAWGDPSPSHLISLNNRKYYTTASVVEVLSRVRDERDIRTIWLDAVCIDQTNVLEKNRQVALMGYIYSSSQQTLVWLGPATEDSDMAMDFIPVLRKILESNEDAMRITDEMLYEMASTDRNSPQWFALSNLLSRAWFQRVWVVQEVALSPIVHVMCGNRSLLWEEISSMIDALYRQRLVHLIAHSLGNQLTSGASTLWCMQDIKTQQKLHGKDILADILFKCMGFLATDPKDKIFGILGLLGDTGLRPHYENSVEYIYTYAVQWSLLKDESFDLLYLAGITHTRNIPSLPSWVPDFSIDIAINPFGILPPGQKAHYTAGGAPNSPAISDLHFRGAITDPPIITLNELNMHPEQAPVCLFAQGIIIDTIDAFGSIRVAPFQGQNEQKYMAWSPWFRQAIVLASSHPVLETRLNAAKGLWKTFIAGCAHPNKDPAPPEYESYFSSFKKLYIDNPQYHKLDWKVAKNLVSDDPDPNIAESTKIEAHQYLFAFIDASIGRRFCTTECGRSGLVPSEVMKGDRICVLRGARAPFVVRETPMRENCKQSYVLVGDCYIEGVMAGEGLEMGKVEEIIIV